MLNFRNNQKLWDLLAATPLIVWFGLGAIGCAIKILDLLHAQAGATVVIIQISYLFFFLLAITLLIGRKPAIRKAKGIGPKLAGFLGSVTPLLVLALPGGEVSYQMNVILSGVGFIGIVGSIYAMLWLGRSFSILPQARGLVTGGPYRFLRHPLYLAEFLVIISQALKLAQPWPILVIALAVAAQISRMRYEERILSDEFPDYRAYMRRTARLIPGLY
jgi:protein-S-isoprenylcysteine O-methyltransferase Ste14